eukprot:3874208-Alexandrium_andersonii.AAC.1
MNDTSGQDAGGVGMTLISGAERPHIRPHSDWSEEGPRREATCIEFVEVLEEAHDVDEMRQRLTRAR